LIPARGATSHRVFFGREEDLEFRRETFDRWFSPGTLEPATTYSWRIDKVTAAGILNGL